MVVLESSYLFNGVGAGPDCFLLKVLLDLILEDFALPPFHVSNVPVVRTKFRILRLERALFLVGRSRRGVLGERFLGVSAVVLNSRRVGRVIKAVLNTYTFRNSCIGRNSLGKRVFAALAFRGLLKE